MPFSISRIIVSEATDKVVALDWAYENADGKISDQWKLQQPYGDKPLSKCTTDVLLIWLEEQLPNSQAEFDAAIAKAKVQRDYSQTLKPYTPHDNGPPTPEVMPVPDVPDLPATADVAATSKSKKKR